MVLGLASWYWRGRGIFVLSHQRLQGLLALFTLGSGLGNLSIWVNLDGSYPWIAVILTVVGSLLCLPLTLCFFVPRFHRWYLFDEFSRYDTRLQLILDTCFQAFVAMEESGIIVRWNRAAERIFGWSRDDVIGKMNVTELMPERFRSDHLHGLQVFLESGYGSILNHTVEMTALRKGGEEFPIEITVSPLRDETLWRFNAFIADISHRKRNQEQKEVLRKTLEEEVEKLRRKASTSVGKGDVLDVVTKLKALVGR